MLVVSQMEFNTRWAEVISLFHVCTEMGARR